jgi:G3E family GTPase
MVTVVDAHRFLADVGSPDDLKARNAALGDDDERNLSQLLVDQVEFADVLVLNKLDLTTADERARTIDVLKQLNPEAELMETTRGAIDVGQLVGRTRFSFDRASAAAGWLKALRGDIMPETVEYGIGSFVYRARRPFHPGRFWAFASDDSLWKSVIRSKGFLWLASRHDVCGIWSSARRQALKPVAAGTRPSRDKTGTPTPRRSQPSKPIGERPGATAVRSWSSSGKRSMKQLSDEASTPLC